MAHLPTLSSLNFAAAILRSFAQPKLQRAVPSKPGSLSGTAFSRVYDARPETVNTGFGTESDVWNATHAGGKGTKRPPPPRVGCGSWREVGKFRAWERKLSPMRNPLGAIRLMLALPPKMSERAATQERNDENGQASALPDRSSHRTRRPVFREIFANIVMRQA